MLEDRINEIKKKMHEIPSEERNEQDAGSGPSSTTDLARFKNTKLFQKFIKKEKSENEAKQPPPSTFKSQHSLTSSVQKKEQSNDEKSGEEEKNE